MHPPCVPGSQRPLNFHVNGDFDKMPVSGSEVFYTGELAEDGGYLIGIRYSVSMQDAAGQEPELVMSLENAGVINDNWRESGIASEPNSVKILRLIEKSADKSGGNAIRDRCRSLSEEK